MSFKYFHDAAGYAAQAIIECYKTDGLNPPRFTVGWEYGWKESGSEYKPNVTPTLLVVTLYEQEGGLIYTAERIKVADTVDAALHDVVFFEQEGALGGGMPPKLLGAHFELEIRVVRIKKSHI